jgi:uncharacterized protein
MERLIAALRLLVSFARIRNGLTSMQQSSHLAADSAGRIVVLDVLRAFALFGIIITHAAGGYLAGRPPSADFMVFSPLDRFVADAGNLLTFGKFFTIFSFLFGLSFAIQMGSAARQGAGFAGRFLWRLVVLALIALIHGAFYTGDILIIYALLGLLLIPLRNLNTKVLVVAGLVLALNVPGALLNLKAINASPPTAEQQRIGAELQQLALRSAQRQYAAKKSGTMADLIHTNFTDALAMKVSFQIRTGRLWMTFGLFLLGLAAGRAQIFRDNVANRRFFKRLLWTAAPVALITSVIALVRPAGFQMASLADLLGSFSWTVQQLSLSAFYLAAVTLLFWRDPAKGLLPRLAPAGKMGLTVYLTQTVFGLWLFYSLGGWGLGKLGELGVAAAVGTGILFYIAQVLLARWWMARFNMGPVEWVWRSATYFKLQPNGALPRAA